MADKIPPTGRIRTRVGPAALLTACTTLALATLVALPATTTATAAAAPTTGAPTSTPPTTAPTTTTTAAPPATTTTAPGTLSEPDKLVLGAIAAEEKLGSVRVDGKVTEGKAQILLDLLVNGDGEGGGVFIQQGNLIKIERVGTLLYLNAPKKFWAAHATAAQTKVYGGKWLALNAADKRFVSFDQFLDPAAIVAAAFQGHTTPLTMGKPTKFAGHKVVVVKDTATTNGKTTTETMYIATATPHVVYKIVDNTSTEVGTIVFSHYGKAVPLTVPPEPINLTNS